MRFKLPVGGMMRGFDKIAQMLFKIVGERKSYKSIKYAELLVLAEGLLGVVQNEWRDEAAINFVGRILGWETSARE